MDRTFNNNSTSSETVTLPLDSDKTLLPVTPENNELGESFKHHRRSSSASSAPLVHVRKVGKKKANVNVHRLAKRFRKRLHRSPNNVQGEINPDEIDSTASEFEVEDTLEETVPKRNFEYIITNEYATSPTSTTIPSSPALPKHSSRPSLSPLSGQPRGDSTTGSGSERGGSERGSSNFLRKLKRISTVGSISPGATPLPSPAFPPGDLRTSDDTSAINIPSLIESLRDPAITDPRSRNRDRDRNIEYNHDAFLKAHTPRKRSTQPSLARGLRKRRTISTQQPLSSSQSNVSKSAPWTRATHGILPTHRRTLTSKSDPDIPSSLLKSRPSFAEPTFVFLQIDPEFSTRNKRSRSMVPRAIISLLFIRIVGHQVLFCFLPKDHPFVSNFFSFDPITVLEPPDDAQWLHFGTIEDLRLYDNMDDETILVLGRTDGGDIFTNLMMLSPMQNSNSFPRTSRSRSRSPSTPMLSPTRIPLLSPKKAPLSTNVHTTTSLLLKAQSPQQRHEFFRFISEKSFNKKNNFRKGGLVIEFSDITDFKRRKGEKDEKTGLAPVKEDDMEIEMDAQDIIHELQSSVHDRIERIAWLMENIDSKTQFVHEHIVLLRELENTVNDLTNRTQSATVHALPPLAERISSASVYAKDLKEQLHDTQGRIRRKVEVLNHAQSLLERLKDNVAVQAQGRRVRWEWVLAIFFISLAVTIWITFRFWGKLRASRESL